MDEKSLEILEFPRVREILSGFTSFSAAKELALGLQPCGDGELIARLLGEVAEARHLLSLEPGFSTGDIQDVREMVEMAAKGKVLEPSVLVSIQKTTASARHMRSNLNRRREEFPLLWDIAQGMTPLPGLEADIARCINLNGEILDTASEKLIGIKSGIRETRRRLMNRLDGMVKSQAIQPHLQESLITEREGRYVIPVKTESRRGVRGIVHDVSNTGATVFIEPLETIDLGNDLRELVIEEKKELERILASLSAAAGIEDVVISRNVALLARLEFTLAKARYAVRFKAVAPAIAGNGKEGKEPCILRLSRARHPLLREKAVPISVEIGRDFSILVITGPNTGGKTVTLKTIGLLCLMAQSGIPVTAGEESILPVFDNIFADIGDEQSIEQTLSTFSWHVSNINRIIRNTTERSLVLLDELGTSTDPAEGAALARGILLYFLSRGITTVATTHFSELKVFAHTTPGIENASLDFDPATFAPTYHLTVGVPGGSNALAIAARLSLPREIIESARGMLSHGTEELEKLLFSLMAEKQKVAAVRAELERTQDEVKKQKNKLETRLNELKEQEQRLIRETRDRLVAKTAELQKEIRRTLSALKRAKALEDIAEAKKTLTMVRHELGQDVWSSGAGRPADGQEQTDLIAVGDSVWVLDTNLKGTVKSISAKGRQLEIQAGATSIKIGRESVVKITAPSQKVTPDVVISAAPSAHIGLELDLRGKRAGEVEAELDHYLNDAALAGLGQVCIVHGVGTGAVRQVVRDFLNGHALVRSFRPGGQKEGGDGVTVVKL
ncbi:MAG: endonuclease MutS2 [Chloroflexota bacterium]